MTRPPTALFLLLLLLLPLAAFCSLPPAPAPFPDFPHLQQRHTLKAATCHREDDLRSLLTRWVLALFKQVQLGTPHTSIGWMDWA